VTGVDRIMPNNFGLKQDIICELAVFVAVSVLIYWFLMPGKWRNVFLLMMSLLLIASHNVKYAVYFLLIAVVVYIGGIFLAKEIRYKENLLKILLVGLIGNLCIFKYSRKLIDMVLFFNPHCTALADGRLSSLLFPLGLSYITFRLIHYVIEIHRKSIPQGNCVDFLLYIFFFPTFLAGPVDRFGRFQPQAVSEKNINLTEVNAALYRIVCGGIKKFIIADGLARLVMPILHAPQGHSWPCVVCAVYGLSLLIYMDFAGYTDMALGISRLFGYKIMENFDRPFLKNNIALYWRSWHISMYSWIRDYFFLPLFGYRASEIKIYIGIFCSMMVFMLWHQGSLNFLIIGIYHGTGLVVWQLFQEIKRKFPRVRALVSQKYLDPFSWLCTFTFVSFGFLLFALDIPSVYNVLQKVF